MKQMDKIDDIRQLRNDTDLRLLRTTPQHDSGLLLPRTTPQHDPGLLLPRTTLHESSQNGFRVNLLANSLRAKLKQQRLQALKAATRGPDGGGHSSATLNNTTDSTEFVLGEPGHVAISVEQMSRGTPTNNSRVTLSPIVSESLTRSRLNSSSIFSSGHSQHSMTPTIKTDKVKNIAVLNNKTDFAEQGDLSCDIKVVKREGIFQPINKYDTVRHPFKRVDSLIQRPSCDYDTYILAGDEQRRVNSERPNGKQLSVSWKPGKGEDGTRLKEADLSVADEKTRSNEDNLLPKVAPEDYAFRRPIFVPAQSKIPSVGVRWTVRTELQETEVKKYTPRKPMWSWLVMQEETRGETQQRHDVPGNFNQPSQSSADHLGSYLKTRVARDLHPVSTALDRLGITASKVKWTVPNTGPVDVQQTVMERLELIKRPGSLLYQ